jgi:Leucine-rich repeat (LRR) protein
MANFRNLKHLDLSSNQFVGAIPTSLKSLTSLTYLFLSDNEYLDQGAIPEWIQDLVNLRELSLRKTVRVGTIPTWLDEFTQLQLLDLSENTLTNTIPPSLGYSSSLRFLLLNRNNLNGTVPEDLNQLNNLGTCPCL